MPTRRNAKQKTLIDDSGADPTVTDDRNYLYLATQRPEQNDKSAQWDVTAKFSELAELWREIKEEAPALLEVAPVIKCPTIKAIHQNHKGPLETFYRDVQDSETAVSFYLPDVTKASAIKRSFAVLKRLFATRKIAFRLHRDMQAGADSSFVWLDEGKRLKFNEPMYQNFCLQNNAVPEKLAERDKAHFSNPKLSKYDIAQLPEEFVVLDTETTGFDYVQGSVTEVAAAIVRKSDMAITARYEKLIAISQKLDWSIVRLTGITDRLLAQKGISAAQAMQGLKEFVKELPIMAHNANFDKSFIDMAFMKNRMPMLKNRWVDSVAVFNNHLPNRPTYRLDALAAEMTPGFKQKHRAMADVEAVVKLLGIIVKKETVPENGQG